MAGNETTIALLQDQMGRLASEVSDLSDKNSVLKSQLDEMKGAENERSKTASAAQKWGPWVGGLIFAVGSAAFGYIVIDGMAGLDEKITSNTEILNGDQVEIARRFERKDQRIIQVEDKIKSIKVPSTSQIKDDVTKLRTEFDELKRDIIGDRGRTNELREDVVALQADGNTFRAGIAEHEEEIDNLEERQSEDRQNIASVQASTGAAFVEVETQIRGLVDVMNTTEANTRQLISIVWRGAFKEELPENDYFPSDIPAKATTQVGKINGN